MSQAAAAPEQPKSVREGSRWIHERPDPADVIKWFTENAPLHEGMDPQRYVTGVTLIPAIEKQKKLVQGQETEERRQTYTPYVRVDTRILYWWDWCRENGVLGVVEAVPVPRMRDNGYFNEHLPPGYFVHTVQEAAGFKSYIGCSLVVRAFKPDVRSGGRGREVFAPTYGTKVVPTANRWGADDDALHKAQTGAMGRALGMAGMLVIPGAGVATYEDMVDRAEQVDAPAASLPAQTAPGVPAAQATTLHARAAELILQLQEEKPDAFASFQAWATERSLNLDDLANAPEASVRGIVRQLEKKLAAE